MRAYVDRMRPLSQVIEYHALTQADCLMIYCARKFSELLLPGGLTTYPREVSLGVSLDKNTISDLATLCAFAT